jgi:arginine exporter protein ArgO
VFDLGAAAGSLLWFSAGSGDVAAGRRLNSPLFWRALDGVVAMM